MNPSCFKHSLTKAERNSFNKQGYLVVKNALNPEKVKHYSSLIDRLNKTPKRYFFLDGFIEQDPSFLEMIDHPVILPKVWDILGHNIYLYHSHISATPDTGEGALLWHRDCGNVNTETDECTPPPRLSVKVAYFLTSTPKKNMGSLIVTPRSHLFHNNEEPNFKESVEVHVEAGDACIFDRRLWHTPGPNRSDVLRKAMFYAYAYRWMRPNDEFSDEFIASVQDPIRKQLLGYYGGDDSRTAGYSYYQPTLNDCPIWQFCLSNK